MLRIPVSSSNLASVGYDPVSQTLEIAFHSGHIYQYFGVPESEYRGLMSAGSLGSYHAAFIKWRYPYRQIA